MSIYLAAFFASMLFVGLRATQQLNVVHDNYLAVLPTSVLMAMCEVFVVANIALRGFEWQLVLSVGCGSGIGCLIAMKLHKKWRKPK